MLQIKGFPPHIDEHYLTNQADKQPIIIASVCFLLMFLLFWPIAINRLISPSVHYEDRRRQYYNTSSASLS